MWRLAGLSMALVLVASGCGGGVEPDAEPAPVQSSEPSDGGESEGEESQDGPGEMGPDPDSIPEGEAPGGLGAVRLPNEPADIQALFDRLPDEMLGKQRVEQPGGGMPGEIMTSYGATEPVGCGAVGFQAMDVTSGDFFPADSTAESIVALFTTGADWDVEDFGRDGELFWVRWNTTYGSADGSEEDDVVTTMWGVAGSAWLFSASAGAGEDRETLTAAFTEAAQTD